MRRFRFGAFARIAAALALFLLMAQLFLVWLYVSDRAEGNEPGYRFPLPERVIAMADLVEAAGDLDSVLIALNGPNLRVEVVDEAIGDLAPPEHSIPSMDALFDDYSDALDNRPVAVFAAIPEGRDVADMRVGDRSVWTRFPLRMTIGLNRGGTLVAETRDDLLTQVYSVPIGFWSGIFASIAALIVLFALHVETRPLLRLADAARRFGNDGRPRPVALAGARETRTLIESFNNMQTRLDDLIQRRRVMLGALGHDLRTHLTRLNLKTETLAGPQAASIGQDIHRMERILQSCLDLAKDNVSFDLEVIELNSFVTSILTDSPNQHISFFPDDEVFTHADPAALERILQNLLENALKFATRITVSVGREPPSIRVSDNGPGLLDEDLDRVFEPFEVGERARTQNQSGIGLGLTISRMLAEAQGATLNLVPGDEGGLTATLLLRPLGDLLADT